MNADEKHALRARAEVMLDRLADQYEIFRLYDAGRQLAIDKMVELLILLEKIREEDQHGRCADYDRR